MTNELLEHLKEVEPGRTVVPMYLIRRPLGWDDGRKHATEVHDDREDVGVMSGDGRVMIAARKG